MKGRRTAMKAALVVAVAGIAGCSNRSSPSILKAHGSESQKIVGVWWLMFAMAAAVYVIVAGFVIAGILRGRRTQSGSEGRIKDSVFIWWGGIIIPVVILAILAVATVDATAQLRKPAHNPLQIVMIGKRWWWDVSYPTLGIRTANQFHVPVGQPLEIKLPSDNVIHDFWIPQLAGKQDNIPGQDNVIRFTVNKVGIYRGECAQFCGVEHARMDFELIADAPDVFGRWATRYQQAPSPPSTDATALGQLVFQREACAGCHTIKGTTATGAVGPDLTDFGARRSIGAVTVQNNPGNLAGWIANSQSIKPGNLMPPIVLSPTDLQNVVAYLESLK
jgi:cytochrome c oxidase subunit 2